MSDLYWDEVLVTHDRENTSVEVSFKKIDGDGFLLSQGDEPGTPGGAVEGSGDGSGDPGEQPPKDDEGDFVPDETPAGEPIPGDNVECGDPSCVAWEAYAQGGYDGPNGWASKVARLYKTDTMYQDEGAELLVDDPAAEGKVWANLFNEPSDFYAVLEYNPPTQEAGEGMDTVVFAASDTVSTSRFANSRTTHENSGGLCDKIYLSKASAFTVARKDLDFALNANNEISLSYRNYGPSPADFLDRGYGFIQGIDRFKPDWDGTLDVTDIPTYPFHGTLEEPVIDFTYLWHRRAHTYFVAGEDSSGVLPEPSNITVTADNAVTGKPLVLPGGLIRVREITYDERRDAYTEASRDVGGGSIYIFKDEIAVVSASSSDSEHNKFYQKRTKNPDSDGTSNGWYTVEVEAKMVYSGPFVPSNGFYEKEWRLRDVSTVSIYKNGRLLVGNLPCGKTAVDHLEVSPTSTLKHISMLDKNQYGFSGYRNDDLNDVTSPLNPGVGINFIKARADSDTSYLLYYEGPDALDLPRSDFGQRFLRQFEEFIQPGYCNRIP